MIWQQTTSKISETLNLAKMPSYMYVYGYDMWFEITQGILSLRRIANDIHGHFCHAKGSVPAVLRICLVAR